MAGNIAKFMLSPAKALQKICKIGADSLNIVVQQTHGRARQRSRRVSHAQIVKCVRLGTIQEGPFLNDKGNWQVTMFRHSAGEELACVVAIEEPNQLVVITIIPGKYGK